LQPKKEDARLALRVKRFQKIIMEENWLNDEIFCIFFLILKLAFILENTTAITFGELCYGL
jgi:hypothetical protein